MDLVFESIDALTLPYTISSFESIYELRIMKFQLLHGLLYRTEHKHTILSKILILILMLPILVSPLYPTQLFILKPLEPSKSWNSNHCSCEWTVTIGNLKDYNLEILIFPRFKTFPILHKIIIQTQWKH